MGELAGHLQHGGPHRHVASGSRRFLDLPRTTPDTTPCWASRLPRDLTAGDGPAAAKLADSALAAVRAGRDCWRGAWLCPSPLAWGDGRGDISALFMLLAYTAVEFLLQRNYATPGTTRTNRAFGSPGRCTYHLWWPPLGWSWRLPTPMALQGPGATTPGTALTPRKPCTWSPASWRCSFWQRAWPPCGLSSCGRDWAMLPQHWTGPSAAVPCFVWPALSPAPGTRFSACS